MDVHPFIHPEEVAKSLLYLARVTRPLPQNLWWGPDRGTTRAVIQKERALLLYQRLVSEKASPTFAYLTALKRSGLARFNDNKTRRWYRPGDRRGEILSIPEFLEIHGRTTSGRQQDAEQRHGPRSGRKRPRQDGVPSL